MEAKELEACWQAWHPRRLATAAVYLHLFVAPPLHRMSRWHARISPKQIYIPADKIQECLHTLASHSMPLHASGRDIAKSDEDAVPSRVPHVSCHEGPGQAIVTAPVVCELCHEGFIGKDALCRHCEKVHGNWAEYRKRVFFEATKAGLHPQEPWVKRAMLQSHSFFLRYYVPSSYNDWTTKVDQAVPRRQEACAICARLDWLEGRYPMYLFAKAEGTLKKADLFYDRSTDDDEDTADGGGHPAARRSSMRR